MSHVALYGNVQMERSRCRYCQTFALVEAGGTLACCGRPLGKNEARRQFTKRLSEPQDRRRKIPLRARRDILSAQDGRCFYCHQLLGMSVPFRGSLLFLSCVWDHQVPFAFSQDNSPTNMVAACSRCNAWKSDMVFQTVDEARTYLGEKWATARVEGA